MKADFDLNADGTVHPAKGSKASGIPIKDVEDSALPGQGGYRPGSGRKPEGHEKSQVAKDYDSAKARKEAALADMHELQYKIKSKEYISRSATREACATMMASLAQSLRGLPDNLERKFSLAPDVAEAIERVINESLADIGEGLQMFTDESGN